MEYKTIRIPGAVSTQSPPVDVQKLEAQLKSVITGEVRFDAGTRAIYATDGSNYRQVPVGVVIPKSEQDIVNTIKICREHNAPVLSRGGGTSLAGQCCNVAVVMDMSKYYNNILKIDTGNKVAVVEPGLVLDELNKAAMKQGLMFGPDPSTHNHCTLGGMIGNNSCGVHSVMAVNHGLGARTSDNLREMEIITYDGLKMKVGPTSEEELAQIISEGGRRGEIYQRLRDLRDKYADEIRRRFPNIPRRVSGYNLDELLPEKGFNVARALAGTEGTCVTILNATMHLLPNPGARSLLLLGYPDVATAGGKAHELLQYQPIGLEGIDHRLYEYMVHRHMHVEDLKMLPEGKAWLILEFGGTDKNDSDANAKRVMEALKAKPDAPTMHLFDDPVEEQKMWKIRESGLGATAFVPGLPDAWEGWEDAAVDPQFLGEYLTDFRKLLDKFNYDSALYGHFGQGCVHCRIDFDLYTAEGIAKYRKFVGEAADLVIRYNGSISGEHGDGQSKAELLPKMFGEKIMEAFREFKAIWDPENKMNPGKVVNPYPIESNLRLGVNYNPAQPHTKFKYLADNGSFARSTLRCVGVGECRKHDGGTMCPSYMVTREEMHSTRGRAHALHEMMNGEVIKEGWKSEFVKEALDLCLACKGCKGECPLHVDIATYKAEFLSHYYKDKLRPLNAYVFGHIDKWSRLATKMPGLVNFTTSFFLTASLMKRLGGIAVKRKIPKYAKKNFKEWFFNRPPVNEGKTQVVLWADTFNNYFHPQIAIAATEVLEYLGLQVIVYQKPLCCGRPLYDFGMLDDARRYLKDILSVMKDDIRRETAVIGLEPSCITVFRDEMMNLFPNNEDAQRLSKNVFSLSEFLEKKVKDYKFPELKKKALVHGHCHQKAIMKMNDEIAVLKKLGLEFEMPESGCCGMAGAFGYDASHYEVSVKAGERVLLPAVRNTPKDHLLILNGFSCQEQVLQQTKRKSLHLAEVLKMAIDSQK